MKSKHKDRHTVRNQVNQSIRPDPDVESWRNKVRKDLEVLENASASEYEAAKKNLHKSYTGFCKARMQASDRGFMGAANERVGTPGK